MYGPRFSLPHNRPFSQVLNAILGPKFDHAVMSYHTENMIKNGMAIA